MARSKGLAICLCDDLPSRKLYARICAYENEQYTPMEGKIVVTKNEAFEVLIKKVNDVAGGKSNKEEKLKAICRLLRNNVPYYNWIGFYIVDPKSPRELLLGPFEGEPTEHVRIAFGRGICGQAAQRRKTFVVQNVSAESNYLSCSRDVKAEIVTPVFKNRKVIGELDIDSHTHSPFTREDEIFLKKVSKIASRIL